ncbi:MAG: tetratricopeptide repeat protein [Bacteroidetes bacterium]|nr:tetratricopeptide repeat protein [Bacteroidota bacterium]
MNRLILIICLLSLSINLIAQKAKVQSAYNYYQYKEYDKAMQAIDEASANEQSMAMPKTWYYRGMIYKALVTDDKFKALAPNGIETAISSYRKALELDPKYEYKPEILADIDQLKNLIFTNGVKAYESKDYAGALRYFEQTLADSPNDTTVLLNCALAARQDGNKEKSKLYYTKLIENKMDDPAIYQSLAALYTEEGNKEKVSEVAAGLKRYPGDQALMVFQLNDVLEKGNPEEALEPLNKAIAADPKNHELYMAKGSMLDKLAAASKEKKENAKADEYNKQAIEVYRKAIEIKPDYFDANYNVGALLFNDGAELINKANDLPPSKQKEYDALLAKANTNFKAAKPYLEKAYQLNNTDQGTLISLKQLYVRLGETDTEIYKTIDAALKK